jgi:FecR protein
MKQIGSVSKAIAYVIAVASAVLVSSAQAVEVGKAVVRSVKGSAQYAEGANWLPLKVGQALKPGSVVRTANDSHVDLFMDENGPVVRLMENTTLGIDKLNYEVTGVDTIVETQLDLKSGRIVGIVKKLAATSKYEIKTPNGVAGIRGTEYVVAATGEVYVLSGSAVVVYVRGDGTVVTQVVNAGEMFDPSTGIVKPVPADQLAQLLGTVNELRGPAVAGLAIEEPIVIFVSPTTGAGTSIKQ